MFSESNRHLKDLSEDINYRFCGGRFSFEIPCIISSSLHFFRGMFLLVSVLKTD